MAIIIPKDWKNVHYLHDGEKDTIAWLADALSDDYVIWAGVEWASRNNGGAPIYGEVDFIVIGPSGDVVMIEQKNGAVSVDAAGDLKKAYGTHEKSVSEQLRHSFNAFIKRWGETYGNHMQKPYVNTVIYLPDHHLADLASLRVDRAQIFDKSRTRELPGFIEEKLAKYPANPEKRKRALEFLEGQLALVLDIGSSLENQERVYQSHGNRLVKFVDALEFSPWRMHVNGCAGSGKTQLGVHAFEAARKSGQRALYVCFNRPLAERLEQILLHHDAHAGAGIVANVDHLVTRYMDAVGKTSRDTLGVDLAALRDRALAEPPKPEWTFDTIVVDEGQDFSPQQVKFVEHLLKPRGRLLWMEDARQAIQNSGADDGNDVRSVPVSTVHLTLRDNYRCGRNIVAFTNQLLKLDPPDIACSAIAGDYPESISLRKNENLVDAVEEQVRALVERGYAVNDIVVLTGMGRERSMLMKRDTLAGYESCRLLEVDAATGRHVYSRGALRVETVYRFKGLQAAAVILAELDFDEITPRRLNLLYTGMTRARSALVMIPGENVARALEARL